MPVLSSLIKTINNLCSENNKKIVIKSGSMTANVTVSSLLALARSIEKSIDLDLSIYSISVSYGAGFFPKVPWIAITRKGKTVSNSASVALCFAKTGEGFVCGAMFHKRKEDGLYQTINRSGKHIILEGGSPKNNYTNKYFNPLDFYDGYTNAHELIAHIKSSIEFMNTINGDK